MELNGIPLHPLVVHAVVVLVPLAALAELVLPRHHPWRGGSALRDSRRLRARLGRERRG